LLKRITNEKKGKDLYNDTIKVPIGHRENVNRKALSPTGNREKKSYSYLQAS